MSKERSFEEDMAAGRRYFKKEYIRINGQAAWEEYERNERARRDSLGIKQVDW